MIRLMRHLAVRLWVTCVPTACLMFLIIPLPGIGARWEMSIAVGGVVCILLWLAAGYLMHQAGERGIRRCILEAEAWDRAGVVRKSEGLFLKAFRIYDSFLLVPWRSRSAAGNLTGAAARFYLARPSKTLSFERAVTVFLEHYADEPEIVDLWLKRLLESGEVGPEEHRVMTHLSESFSDSPKILCGLALAFVRSRRTDYAARKVYQHVKHLPSAPSGVLNEIHGLVGRVDGLSQPGTQRSSVVEKEPVSIRFRSCFKGMFSRAESLFAHLFRTVSGVLSVGLSGLRQGQAVGTKFLKQRAFKRAVAVWGLSGIGILLLLFFIVNTVVYLNQQSGAAKTMEKTVNKSVPGRYTIQVAAYLKKAHAETYLSQLLGQGFDAYISSAEGGGRTWFLVRIASFPDRTSARNYGNRLKKDGVIEDFFVDNLDNDR